MTELVLRDDAGGICTLTLNRPEKRNAIDRELFKALRSHIRDLEGDETVGVVVLRGAGGHFCAGHDLSQPAHADALGWHSNRAAATLCTRPRSASSRRICGWQQ